MTDSIFGTLSTMELRIDWLRARTRGIWHGASIKPHVPQEGEAPTISVNVGVEQAISRLLCRLQEPEQATLPLAHVATQWDTLNWSYYQVWKAVLPPRSAGTLVRYTLEAYPAGGGDPVPADDGPVFSYLVGDPRPPAWAAEAIVYQVFPDRFHPGQGRSWRQQKELNEFCGGTLGGIIDNLDYIADLGFNVIWLNPFFPDNNYHGYHATDYLQVNPRLGSTADVRELVTGAHDRGIRLLLDFVANHWGSGHPTFQAAVDDPQSDYYHWYYWKTWPRDYKTFFGVRDLPQINVDYLPARQHLLDAATHWLGEFNFDGFRLDYALGPSLDFWTEFRQVIKRVRPDAWLVGEVVEPPTTQLRYWGRLDGCLDFMLFQALRNTFAYGTMELAALDAFLECHEVFFPPDFSRPSFLDNHDVNRFLWLVGGNTRKLKLAALCQFTLSGPPMVYYGTEAGLSQQRDIVQGGRHIMEEPRLPMIWGQEQDSDLRAFYRWLIHFRRQHPVLWRGRRQTIHLDGVDQTYAYQRMDDIERVTVALNLSDEERTFEAAGEEFRLLPWSGDLRVVPS